MDVAEIREHVADGIEEYDNPLPAWWLYGFYASIAFALVYAVVYPSLWCWSGTARWTSAGQYDAMVASAPKVAVAKVDLEKMSADPGVVAKGHEIFKTYCVACHGDNAEGKIGPPLVAHKWRYGGDPDSILTTIRGGRPNGMPTWSKAISDDKIQLVAAYVFSLSHGASAPESGPSGAPAGVGSPQPTASSGKKAMAPSTDLPQATLPRAQSGTPH